MFLSVPGAALNKLHQTYTLENQWDFNGHDVCLMEGVPVFPSCL